MSEDSTVLPIRYVGKQPKKRDNVAGSAFVWYRRGEVHDVPRGIAVRLLLHPDVWVVADGEKDPLKGTPITGLSDADVAKELPGMTYLMTRVEQIKAAIDLIDRLDGWDDVAAYREMGEIVMPEATVKQALGALHSEVITKVGFSNERQESIAEAIRLLDPNNKEHFTDTGIPRVDAINALLGSDEPVTALERTEIWEEIQEANAGRDAA